MFDFRGETIVRTVSEIRKTKGQNVKTGIISMFIKKLSDALLII